MEGFGIERDDGLAASDISLDQPVHGFLFFQILHNHEPGECQDMGIQIGKLDPLGVCNEMASTTSDRSNYVNYA